MAVSSDWEALFVGVLVVRALRVGVYNRAFEFLETPNGGIF